MRAMILEMPGQPLRLTEIPIPTPGKGQVLLKVIACGVCRTDLHIVDGELPHPKLPLVPGHQIVGQIVALGEGIEKLQIGERIGVPWLSKSCEKCRYCTSGRENLCDDAIYTGYGINGGFAEYCLANQQFSFPIAESYASQHAAPLLCAGLIGYRSYGMAGNAKSIGMYGFGAAAHILTQVAHYQGRDVYIFTRTRDAEAQEIAFRLGAKWVGTSEELPPVPLDAAIIFAPVGTLIPKALRAVDKGGIVICAGIHMSDIPSFPYSILWEERSIRSVANLTRKDGNELLALAPLIPIKTEVTCYPLEKVNQALQDLREGNFYGSAVVCPF